MMGRKKHETRHWRPPEDYIGQRIGMHAAQKLWKMPDVSRQLVDAITEQFGCYLPPSGCLLGSVLLAEVYQADQARREAADPFDVLAGDWSDGRWLWRLEDPRPLEPMPLPMRGFQKWGTVDLPELV
jgi:hypothetical protein